VYDTMKGVKVVEVAGYVLVPAAGAVLADWGADVLKVEHPRTGDPYRGIRNDFVRPGLPNPMLELPNRGKRSIGIDIAQPEGRELLYELIADADVFLTSFLSGSLARLGLDLEQVRAVNPNIVYGRATGYGRRGPDADKPSFDGAATWARAGFMHRMTAPDAEDPVLQPGSVGDLTGALSLAMGVSASLFHRERTGEAQEVDVSLLQVGMWLMAQSIAAAPLGLEPLPARANRHNPWNPLVNPYRTSDGRWLMLTLLTPDPYWPDLCVHLGRMDLIDDPRFSDIDVRQEHAAELVKLLDEVFATKSLEEWRVALDSMTGPWAPALSAAELGTDEQVRANDYFPEVEGHDGTRFRTVASPVQFGGRGVGRLDPMPECGQHTEEVLLARGYDWEALGRLKAGGVIT
jgi:crotonobetainyl-CoA:carnitine CoA-transferase CaiB-like acyl-CoA transferase